MQHFGRISRNRNGQLSIHLQSEEEFQTMKSRKLWLWLLLLTLLQAQVALAQEPSLQGFDEYINKAMKEWDVPGVAIALIKNDKIILAKGYGVKKLGDPAPVNERTLIAIGSSSKAFTAALVAMMVDEGKMKWDDPIAKHLSGFQI
jgi:CubicO group peptidase (beta-lactamase class C family)